MAWYLGVIGLGTAALLHPACWNDSATSPLSVLDAFFTATSAATVTGLAVRSTGHEFSVWGQLVILILIQVGGLGIMTITTFFLVRLGAKTTLRQKLVTGENVGDVSEVDLGQLLFSILRVVFVIEFLGFLILLGLFSWEEWNYPSGNSPVFIVWSALFHTVSAFCNAGFSLHDDSLVRYQSNTPILVTFSSLILLGGIGFPVLVELGRFRQGRRSYWSSLSLHTRFMLIGTLVLDLIGTGSILWLEHNNTLEDLNWIDKIDIALFHSISCRTAGFHAIPVENFTSSTLFIISLLMLIGGGSASCAGGIKVTTLMVLVLQGWSRLMGYTHITVFRRTLTRETVDRAVAAVSVFAVCHVVGLLLILQTDAEHVPHHASTEHRFLELFFETASALGTTGLSTGETPTLTVGGKFIIIALMFIGRLGPISFYLAIRRTDRKPVIQHASGSVLIG